MLEKKLEKEFLESVLKLKVHPKNLETTVNPIKTLTPRFITRTLEKIKKIKLFQFYMSFFPIDSFNNFSLNILFQ